MFTTSAFLNAIPKIQIIINKLNIIFINKRGVNMYTRINNFQERSTQEIFRRAFYYSYPFDGFDPVDVKGKAINRTVDPHLMSQFGEYKNHPLTFATSFLGIPNKSLSEN